MTILGIDTTGYSTAVSVVQDGKKVLLNFVNPGYNIKKQWSEVVKILPQMHFDYLMKNFDKLLANSGIVWDTIDVVAVSAGSGIESCIIMGKSFAKNFAEKHSKPLIEVDHVLAHLYSTWIERDVSEFNFPILSFSSSGSHNSLLLISTKKYSKSLGLKDIYDVNNDTKFHVGIGKYFFRLFTMLELDKEENGWHKFFKLMGDGDPKKYSSLILKVKRTYAFRDRMFDFSDFLYGIKNFLDNQEKHNIAITDEVKGDLAAGFQAMVSKEVSQFLLFMARIEHAKEVHLSGGISMNKSIEHHVVKIFEKELPEVKVRIAKDGYKLDNAAMIASLAYYQEKYGIKHKYFRPIITK